MFKRTSALALLPDPYFQYVRKNGSDAKFSPAHTEAPPFFLSSLLLLLSSLFFLAVLWRRWPSCFRLSEQQNPIFLPQSICRRHPFAPLDLIARSWSLAVNYVRQCHRVQCRSTVCILKRRRRRMWSWWCVSKDLIRWPHWRVELEADRRSSEVFTVSDSAEHGRKKSKVESRKL